MKLLSKTLGLLFGKYQAGKLTGSIIQKSIWLFLMHCFAIVLGFVLNFLMVRFAGAENFGGYTYVFNLLALLVSFTTFGTETLVLSKVPRYLQEQKFSLIKGLLVFSFIIALVLSLLTSAITKFLPPLQEIIRTKTSVHWLSISIPVLIMLSITAISQAGIQASGKPVASQGVEKVLRPVLMIVMLPLYVLLQKNLSTESLIWLNTVAIAIGVIVLLKLNLSSLRVAPELGGMSVDRKVWLSATAGFFLVNVMSVLNSRIDVLILGFFKGNTEIGMYSIASRISELLRFSLTIVNFILAPFIVKMYDSNSKKELQELLLKTSRVVFFISCFLVLIIFLFSEFILTLFDESYIRAKAALMLLCAGQLVNVFFGSVGLVLLMSGNQKYALISLTAGTLLNLVLSFVLVPRYGINGAAIASASGLILWNCLMYIFVRRQTGLQTTAIRGL